MLTIDNLNEHQVVTKTATGKLTKEGYVRLLSDLGERLILQTNRSCPAGPAMVVR